MAKKWYVFGESQKTTIRQITTSKMIITLRISQVNFKKRLPQEIQVFSAEELQEFISQGAVAKKKKQYLLIIHHRQITIECPVLRMDDGQYQIIWPSFKLPYRPYPVFVYLYAVALYLSSGESMRATAEKTLKTFGLETFSHTTISRFLSKIYQTLPYLIGYGVQIANDWGVSKCRVIRRKGWKEALYEKARQLYRLIDPVLRSPPEFGNWLAYQCWQDTNSFIV